MKTYIGIDVGGTTIKAAVVTQQGEILANTEKPTEVENGKDRTFDVMTEMVKELLKSLHMEISSLSGIGIGVPAFIDFETAMVAEAVNLGWKNVNVAEEIQKRIGNIPVLVENDANAAALGEVKVGAGRGYKNAICITLGTGVGGGIVVDGKIVHGTNGMAGEIGHITVLKNGRECNCGRRGCLETISSATGILKTVHEAIKRKEKTILSQLLELNLPLSAKEAFESAKAGDHVALTVVNEAMDTLAFAMSNMALTMNPDLFIIGGGVSKAGDFLLTMIKEKFESYAVPRIYKGTEIKLAVLGNNAGVIGNALLHEM